MVGTDLGNSLTTLLKISGVLVDDLQIPLQPPLYSGKSMRPRLMKGNDTRVLIPFAANGATIQKLLEHPELIAGQIGYNAPLVLSSPDPVPTASETNTSWTIPWATDDLAQVRAKLGIDTVQPLQKEPIVVAVLDGGILKGDPGKGFDVVGGWVPDPAKNSPFGTGHPHGNMVAWDIRVAAPTASFYDVGVLKGKDGQPPCLADAQLGLDWVLARYLDPNAPTSRVVCCQQRADGYRLHEATAIEQ